MTESQAGLAGFELSAQQEESLLRRQVASRDSVSAVVSIAGRLDPTALRDALDAVTARHEALRTTFHRRPGLRVPLQVIRDRLAPGWRQVDLRAPQGQQDAKQAERIAAVLAEEASRPSIRSRVRCFMPRSFASKRSAISWRSRWME